MDRKKRYKFGQNYLKDPIVINNILSAIKPTGSKVLEIGPGNGALTFGLLKKHSLTCIEIDHENIQYLKNNIETSSVEIIHHDFLSWNPLTSNMFEIIVGNLPYNISSQILLRILFEPFQPNAGFFMLQKEMAERIASSPGSRNWSKLSVKCSLYYQSEILFEVPPECFDIKPKIMSVFMRMVKKEPLLSSKDAKNFFKFIDLSFQYKRKTLINNLKTHYSESSIKHLIDQNQRPEEVSVEQYVNLFKLLEK